MGIWVLALILLPLLGFALLAMAGRWGEVHISRIAWYTALLHSLLVTLTLLLWIRNGADPLNFKEWVLFQNADYSFFIDFYLDEVSAVFVAIGSFISLLIIRYSRFYMHMESGYNRFFQHVMLFFFGYNLTALAGSFETLFIGWEFLGISSFLLVGFYRQRYLPVKHAVRVFSVYRIGDVGILLAMWASHHFWHENITFLKLHNNHLVHEHLAEHSAIGALISLGLLLAAMAKSAQYPFSSWLPRAMEGPTPSSAIFYGSLSVHFGLFLLLRTETFWENQFSVRVLIATMGLSTSVIAYLIAKVQTNVKTQIAYSSISQIGIMFLELALGWNGLVLLHFAANAFLRTYQLLVSPSMVAYKIRDQFYHGSRRSKWLMPGYFVKIQSRLYAMALAEFRMDQRLNRWVFKPIKAAGRKLPVSSVSQWLTFTLPLWLLVVLILALKVPLNSTQHHVVATVLAAIGMLGVFRAFSERQSPFLAWILVASGHVTMSLAVSFNESFSYQETLWYLSGVGLMGWLGWLLLHRMKAQLPSLTMHEYYGYGSAHKRFSSVFLLASLGLMGFPISPTFIGEDLLFSHIHEQQILFALFFSLSYIVSGISLIRVYARLFLGREIRVHRSQSLLNQ
jgi:NADH-quinone oxidoreductase subunit L